MSISDERLAEIAEWARSEEADCLQDDMPVSASYYADIVKLVAAAKVRANSEGDGEVGAGWEKHSLEEKQRVQKNAGIPHLPTDMTYEARLAIAGEGPRGFEWSDKKHRLVYDLCREIERIAALASIPATGGEKK